MNKYLILPLLMLFCTTLIYAQAPQGLNYQAVAYNGSGVPVPNQLMGVRLSILDGSATGTLVYEETQNPTTDNTGLFSIVIGNGTVVSGTFNTINWGNGSKWLKTEIDITGGTSYVVMGTSQFMSVPYALYANKSSFTSGSFSNPDGFEHPMPIVVPMNTNYTVPTGKNLYIQSGAEHIIIDDDTLLNHYGNGGTDSKTFIGASENSVIKAEWGSLIGFLVDKTVDWKTMEIDATGFTVPANKQFVIVNSMSLTYNQGFPTCLVALNGNAMSGIAHLTNMILDANDFINVTGCAAGPADAKYLINGYFKDK